MTSLTQRPRSVVRAERMTTVGSEIMDDNARSQSVGIVKPACDSTSDYTIRDWHRVEAAGAVILVKCRQLSATDANDNCSVTVRIR